MSWQGYIDSYVTYFEHLFGAHRGGLYQQQLEQVRNILFFLGVQFSKEGIEYIARNAFCTSVTTFRKGCIGTWKEGDRKVHKKAMKEICAELLIELA